MEIKKEGNKRIKKRLREGITINDLLEGWTQCNYFLKSKNRLCNIGKVKGSNFCGLHRPNDEQVTLRVFRNSGVKNIEEIYRIPCPIDPAPNST